MTCPVVIAPERIDRCAGGKLNGTKLPVADGDIADFSIVLAREGDGLSLVLVDLAGAQAATQRQPGGVACSR